MYLARMSRSSISMREMNRWGEVLDCDTVKDESLGLVSVSRLKVPRLSVSY